MRAVDLSGQRFGRLVARTSRMVRVGKQGAAKRLWLCFCDCGNFCEATYGSLRYGNTTSCGCYIQERMKSGLRLKHGAAKRKAALPEYRVWTGMWKRCINPNEKHYSRYGGRGIAVCDEWQDFTVFYREMGTRPSPAHSIERRDNDLGYSKANCAWATPKEQANNTRRNVRLTFQGRTLTIAQWSGLTSLAYHTIKNRVGRLGWTAERALTEPSQIGRRRVLR